MAVYLDVEDERWQSPAGHHPPCSKRFDRVPKSDLRYLELSVKDCFLLEVATLGSMAIFLFADVSS